MASDTGKRKGEDYDVVPSLMDVLNDALDAKGRRAKHVAYRADKDKKTVQRYLDREHFPTGADLDNVVAVVAAEAEVDRFTLWREAIQSAEETIKRNGLDPRQEAAAAVRSLPPSGSD